MSWIAESRSNRERDTAEHEQSSGIKLPGRAGRGSTVRAIEAERQVSRSTRIFGFDEGSRSQRGERRGLTCFQRSLDASGDGTDACDTELLQQSWRTDPHRDFRL